MSEYKNWIPAFAGMTLMSDFANSSSQNYNTESQWRTA